MGSVSSETQQFLSSSFLCLFLIAASFKVVGASLNACSESQCGNDQHPAIHFPFLRRHQKSGLESHVLVKFLVKHIDYRSQEISVYHSYNCLLLKPLEIPDTPVSKLYFFNASTRDVTVFRCRPPVEEDDRAYLLPCRSDPGFRFYGVSSYDDLEEHFWALKSCTKKYDILSLPFGDYAGNPNYAVLRFKWSEPNCTECEALGRRCRLKNNSNYTSEFECVHFAKPSETTKWVATGATLGSIVVSLLVAAVYRVYSVDRKEKENQFKIERFLEDYKALKPSRYSYEDIKRITNKFMDNLGQGAYGVVFKGRLSSELFVAVKVLNNSNGNGEEFVNEVETMGHIHHVNVVRLVGFCADGFRRALVYEFFPNGSLQDFISAADNAASFLGWEKLQDIAIGIAKGIEYLHLGCDQRIVHFDIKPHNVLLDHNLIPKISDFGLAKLCSKDQSLVSMTTARGTMGYIAPEVFSRSFGNVSYKSDVYSFGMLLLEMVGGRKNTSGGSTTENSNEVYYPQWIYNLLEGGEDLRIHIGEEGDGKIPKKLAIVGLWCIQWHPVDRPSMKTVVQMLGGGGEDLTMPPNPFGSTAPTATTNARIPARRQELEPIIELE